MGKKQTINNALQDIFKTKEPVAVSHIYEIILSRDDVIKPDEPKIAKHRIRGCIHIMKKQGKLRHVSTGIYQAI